MKPDIQTVEEISTVISSIVAAIIINGVAIMLVLFWTVE